MGTTLIPKILLLKLLSLLFLATSAFAASYDAAADFSISNGNPNSVWSYGWSTDPGGTFNLMTNSANEIQGKPGIESWEGNFAAFGELYPTVFKNTTDNIVTLSSNNIPLLPGQLLLHPDGNGNLSIVRFIAPADAVYTIASAFEGRDLRTTTTDVHVLLNGVSLFDEIVTGFGSASEKIFNTTLSLVQGDELEFAVGWGLNNSFNKDTTALSARITSAVPIPSSFLIFGAGLFGLAGYRRKIEGGL